MPADRQTIETEVRYTLGQVTGLTSDITSWVRRAYQAITQRVEFPEAYTVASFSSTTNVQSYALPTNFHTLYTLVNTSEDRGVIQELPSELLSRETSPTGKVSRCALLGNDLYLWRVPDAVYSFQLHYRRFFADLDDGTDAVEVPSPWEQLIVWEAASYGFDARDEQERALEMQRRISVFIATHEDRLAQRIGHLNSGTQIPGLEIS